MYFSPQPSDQIRKSMAFLKIYICSIFWYKAKYDLNIISFMILLRQKYFGNLKF
jgi:uncharacterized membrane protein YhfC